MEQCIKMNWWYLEHVCSNRNRQSSARFSLHIRKSITGTSSANTTSKVNAIRTKSACLTCEEFLPVSSNFQAALWTLNLTVWQTVPHKCSRAFMQLSMRKVTSGVMENPTAAFLKLLPPLTPADLFLSPSLKIRTTDLSMFWK